MNEKRRIRVLLAKPGLDGHNRGVKVVLAALREAGMEVVYTGIRQTPDAIAKAAIEEDVHVVGLSNLSGAHMVLFPAVAQELKSRGGEHILLIGGGIISQGDRQILKETGFAALFTPGASTEEIVEFIERSLI